MKNVKKKALGKALSQKQVIKNKICLNFINAVGIPQKINHTLRENSEEVNKGISGRKLQNLVSVLFSDSSNISERGFFIKH